MRDLPRALARDGWSAAIMTPSYGMLHRIDGSTPLGELSVPFRGESCSVEVFEVPAANAPVRNLVFDHPFFSPQGDGRVYCNDAPDRPFATDANKFAFFSATLASWIASPGNAPDVLHLHDWHTGFYLMLREFDPNYSELRDIRTVFTIHNLAYQGQRPLAGDESSLESWFPGLRIDLACVRDPGMPGCVNPMAAAIRLSDRISTVSPSYAREICLPSDPARGFIGGEGLERDLEKASREHRLVGILNGCEYPETQARRPAWPGVTKAMADQVDDWRLKHTDFAGHELAAKRIAALGRKRPASVLLSIGRLVSQKVSLFLQPLHDGVSALEHLLRQLGDDGVFILLGSGDTDCERQVLDVAETCPSLIFLRGYAEALADVLYPAADLFLMPSSFEPCGISQMVSMRNGVPCVVHGVGGLSDTVNDRETGFVFTGPDPAAQARNFVAAVMEALQVRSEHPTRWRRIGKAAAAVRFDWKLAAQQTVAELYEN